jgi:hypothetical protein
MKLLSLLLASSSLLTLVLTPSHGADVPVTVTVDVTQPGYKIAPDYAGLSYETKREMPGADGKYYFSPQNAPLIKMFQTLGIKNLRIGGNTVDSSKVTIPVQADIDQLFQFAKAADTKVIYSFRLNKGDPQGSAAQAKYIADNYAPQLICFSIGNEPDIFVHSYQGWVKEWQPIYDAINQAVPNAIFLGPSLTSNAQPWAHDFARDYFPSGKILYVTQHQYAGGAGGKVTDPVAGREMMLSPEWQTKYQEYYDKFGAPLLANHVPYRLEEGNNFYNGGAKDVSDTFASALWSLDYLYWWAAHGSQGINFHNGDEVAAGQSIVPCRYASFTSAPDGYFAHPIAYAIKLFNLGAKGALLPSKVEPDASAKDLGLVSYAVLGDDKAVYVTLINKEHGAAPRDAVVTLKVPTSAATKVDTMALTSPNNDLAAKEGIQLGGNPIKKDGSWTEAWTSVPTTGGAIQVKVPASSILLVRISP